MALFPTIPPLTITLLIGTGAIAPSILALGYANYSNRGELLVRTKGLQLAVFLMLSVLLISADGTAGCGDRGRRERSARFSSGCSAVIIIRQTLQHPARHVAFLAAVMVLVTSAGWALGASSGPGVPGTGLPRFAGECTLWLVVAALAASPLLKGSSRRLIAAIR